MAIPEGADGRFYPAEIRLKDQEAYEKELKERGVQFFERANLFRIINEVHLEKGLNRLLCDTIVEPCSGCFGLRLSWDLQRDENNGWNPKITCKLVEIRVNVTTGTLLFEWAKESDPERADGLRLIRKTEFLTHEEWGKEQSLIKEALVRAIESPMREITPSSGAAG